MKNTSKLRSIAAALFAISSFTSAANAALTISNWSATESTLSFDITGTITDDVAGGNAQQRLVIGIPGGNPEFVTNDIDYSDILRGSTRLDPSAVNLGLIYMFPNEATYLATDIIHIEKASQASFAVGDVLNHNIYFSDFDGDATLLNPEDVIVSWGYTVIDAGPELAHQVGAAAVPEPSSALLLGLGALALTARRKRS
ncbi:PEP-CTERM sorting domain-containing protein [Verrucomicrobiaceae bacterium 5K15]|uniref:PEP-CTERM sorting domain-containing protein n=1 Tax=Oceaniferula flava TaxID=2800421 RepID=A0AAE2SBB2_9BACT|nr:PEP-CTERM sorting domain-containing protein [Oceaniferula flavus]MBK1855303.1 PEP-CTERM sorting domain-containing protein [Oceaniferula flavus]MBM1136609.1 PEP-CTERM sorting domain-containing protein [Oceaniferula flavus]